MTVAVATHCCGDGAGLIQVDAKPSERADVAIKCTLIDHIRSDQSPQTKETRAHEKGETAGRSARLHVSAMLAMIKHKLAVTRPHHTKFLKRYCQTQTPQVFLFGVQKPQTFTPIQKIKQLQHKN